MRGVNKSTKEGRLSRLNGEIGNLPTYTPRLEFKLPPLGFVFLSNLLYIRYDPEQEQI